ncbi:MAG: hypothetical protein MEQ84_11715 [Mesorhizobium sp.]|nr:hypothetical protein [Mesorhizobium sp.]
MTSEPAKATAGEAVHDDDLNIDVVLARFHGDPYAALGAAIDDIAYLRKELVFASLTMSYGYARGWTPLAKRQT